MGLLAHPGRSGGPVVERPAVFPRLPGAALCCRTIVAPPPAAGSGRAPPVLVGSAAARGRHGDAPRGGVFLRQTAGRGGALTVPRWALPPAGGLAGASLVMAGGRVCDLHDAAPLSARGGTGPPLAARGHTRQHLHPADPRAPCPGGRQPDPPGAAAP